VEQAHTLQAHCSAAFAAVSSPAADDQCCCWMEAALQQVTTAVAGLQQGAGRVPTGQGAARQGTTAHGVGQRQRGCYRCGSATHMWEECPHPFEGQGALSSGAQCSECMLDSGCTRDMHHGGDLRKRAFSDYRKFDKPILVFFGKRGVTAAAVGLGTMALQACEGALILPDALYVPELHEPLYSMKAALRRGLSVHFWPSSKPGGADQIILIQNGRTVLTAGPRGDLYCLHEQPTLMAAARMATASARELDVAQDCHRSLGHVRFGTLPDLCRAGMLRDDVTPAAFVQARKESVCEPCVLGKLRRGSHPSRRPQQIRMLG
jgi:hypothetical protein